ncbi:MAG TPA: DUF5671 domain-containing protein [Candidatus Paceibacterota bacterium]|nr:DUF5671 domain-containing protein [Candidatus Paceibacterota bacterium]
MDKPKITPKDFFLWAGAMITLYWSIIAFILLIFSYLNYAMPDPLQYYSADPYSAGISYQMASLIVFFPLFLVLMRVIRTSIARDATRAEVWVRRWALYLTLFVAAVTVAVDLVTLIMYFFNGDVTLRFALKVLVILLVAGGGFLHFLADLKGYWQQNSAKARLVGWATAVLVLVTIVAGFFIVGTPWEARLYRYDEQKVSDLQEIQAQVVTYWQAKQQLPGSLADLTNAISGFTAPTDPQTGAAYEYQAQGVHSFELCATFNAETQPYAPSVRSAPLAPGVTKPAEMDVWYHGAGRVCFERTIDPALYPPLK